MYVPDMIEFVAHLLESRTITGVRNVAEVGAQEVFAAGFESSVERFIRSFHPGAVVSKASLRQLSFGTARALYQFVGCNYSCMDVIEDGEHRFYRKVVDLNSDRVPRCERGRYDLVTNLGVSQHVLNQAGAFEAVHDLAAPRGYMLHYLPLTGRYDDLFFYYEPCFFESLAQANGYRVEGMWVFVPGDHLSPRGIIPWSYELPKHLRSPLTFENEYYVLVALLQKEINREFKAFFNMKALGDLSRPILDTSFLGVLGEILKLKRDAPFRTVLTMGEIQIRGSRRARDVDRFLKASGSETGVGEVSSSDEGREIFEKAGCRQFRCIERNAWENGTTDLLDGIGCGESEGELCGYDLVINLGISSRILDQLGFFERTHRLTSVGGVIFHIVPMVGYSDSNGFCYDLAFFEELAFANGYDLLGSWVCLPSGFLEMSDNVLRYLRIPEHEQAKLLWMSVALQKRYAQEFQIPFQEFYKSVRSDAVGRNYSALVNGRLGIDNGRARISRRERRAALEEMRRRVVEPPPDHEIERKRAEVQLSAERARFLSAKKAISKADEVFLSSLAFLNKE